MLDGDRTINSLQIQGNGSFSMNDHDLTIAGENSSGRALDIGNSTVTFVGGTGTLIFTQGSGSTKLVGTQHIVASTELRNVQFNGAATFVMNGAMTVNGNLTISAGTLSTSSDNNYALTVTGDVTIAAAGGLVCNSSTVSVDSFTISSGGTLSAPDASGSLTLNGTKNAWSFQNNSTNFSHNNGTITQTNAGHIKSVSSNPMYNFIMNSSSSDSHEAVFRPSSGTDCVIAANDVTVTRGIVKLNTVSNNASMGSLTIGSTGTFQASSGTTTITSMTSTGSGDRSLSLVSGGTFTNNSGTVLLNGGSDQRIQMAGTGNLYNLTINKANNEIVTFGDLTILNNLDVTLAADHTWRPNATSDTLTVHGNTYLTTGRINNGSTQYAGVNNWGNVTINSGEFVLSSGTNNFTGIRNIGGTISQS